MDCIGQPGVDLKFHAYFNSGFSFFCPIDLHFRCVFQSFEAFLNILTKRSHCEALQSQLLASFSVVETRPVKMSCWVKLFNAGNEKNLNILKTAQNFRRLEGNGDQSNRKTKTTFEISVKFWIYPWLSNAIHWPRTLSTSFPWYFALMNNWNYADFIYKATWIWLSRIYPTAHCG